ncbi:glucose-6-phosphate isomerase [Haliangium sp.]|uniref:glucose-6-phosphate isomerase n=1 Tax=Haliangium sp. TaxID=2663208 RepID=UPI003D0D777E
MSSSKLDLDLTCLMDAGLGAAGVSEAELDRMAEAAAQAVDTTLARRAAGEVGFLDLPDDHGPAREAMDYARSLPIEIDTMVVLGIGGSSLGPHAVYSALAPAYDQLRERAPGMPRRLLFPDNIDPVGFAALLDLCPPERTVFNVVTKSGGTAETAAQFLVVFDRLERALGPDRSSQHLVLTTDPERGALRQVAGDLGLRSFAIPANVGGRFSVLSPVGLVPAAVAGLDVVGLLEGAARMRDRVTGDDCRDLRKNPALLLATLLYLHHSERGRPMTVMMSYVDALFDIADWFRQLWAESLGKAVDVHGNQVNVGPTPIAARGATDQHSQLQLYAEGPDDKVMLFLGARERGVEMTMPASRISSASAYAYLVGRGMGELLDAELRGTRASLSGRGRPNATITLDRVEASAVGELLMLLEATTAFAGPLYGIDPYDQPGVEEAKRLAYGALGRDGYADEAAKLEALPSPDPRYQF